MHGWLKSQLEEWDDANRERSTNKEVDSESIEMYFGSLKSSKGAPWLKPMQFMKATARLEALKQLGNKGQAVAHHQCILHVHLG